MSKPLFPAVSHLLQFRRQLD